MSRSTRVAVHEGEKSISSTVAPILRRLQGRGEIAAFRAVYMVP